ncbi:hypothetical protein G9A89_005417 [Geosiphon pyriformis]|nr:hypothetical protein G9A89_005417 [Geosiphon pyriformis]
METSSHPLDSEVTVAEIDGKLLHLSDAHDPRIELYAKAEGVLYPNLTIPNDIPIREIPKPPLNLRKRPAGPSLTEKIGEWKSETECFLRDSIQNVASTLPVSLGNLIYDLAANNFIASLQKDREKFPAMALAWHPYNSLFAVVHRLDAIFLYDLRVDSWFPEALETDLQKEITSLAWKPLGGNILAVGCRRGICLWEIPLRKDATLSSDTSVSFSTTAPAWMHYMNYPGHENIPTILSWSPEGAILLSGTLQGNIIIWETRGWTCKIIKGNVPSPIKSACWTPNGKFVFLAHSGDSNISTLAIVSGLNYKWLVVQDLLAFPGILTNEDIGGSVRELSIDPTGQRLIVCFQETKLLALFHVNQSTGASNLLTRMTFMRGPSWNQLQGPGQVVLPSPPKAVAISFAKQFMRGGLLSVIWEDGKISFIPLVYSKSKTDFELYKT